MENDEGGESMDSLGGHLTRQVLLQRAGLIGVALAVPSTLAAPALGAGSAKQSASQKIRRGGLLIMGNYSPRIDSLNPFVAFNGIPGIIQYPCLVSLDQNLQVKADWAESWEFSKKGRVITFHLRRGKWSDGRPLTAQDWAWTGNYLVSRQTILGYVVPDVERMVAINAKTLEVTLKAPIANALYSMAGFFAVPRHVWAPHAEAINDFHPEDSLPVIAGGPFRARTFDPQGTTIFEPNPAYHHRKSVYVGGLAYVNITNQDVAIQALKSGDVHFVWNLSGAAISALSSHQAVKVVSQPGLRITTILVNRTAKQRTPALRDVRVLKAISAAIDRKTIASVIYRGAAKPVPNWVSPAGRGKLSWINPKIEANPFNVANANRLLDLAGYKQGSGGSRVDPATRKPLEVALLISDGAFPDAVRYAGLLRTQLAAVGITLNLEQADRATFRSRLASYDYDLALDLVFSDFDPDAVLQSLTTGYGPRSAGWSNKDYDVLYAQQARKLNPSKRRKLVWEMQEILDREQVVISILALDYVTAISTTWDGILTQPPPAWTPQVLQHAHRKRT